MGNRATLVGTLAAFAIYLLIASTGAPASAVPTGWEAAKGNAWGNDPLEIRMPDWSSSPTGPAHSEPLPDPLPAALGVASGDGRPALGLGDFRAGQPRLTAMTPPTRHRAGFPIARGLRWLSAEGGRHSFTALNALEPSTGPEPDPYENRLVQFLILGSERTKLAANTPESSRGGSIPNAAYQSTAPLLAAGLVGLGLFRRRRH